jgi:dihydroorotase
MVLKGARLFDPDQGLDVKGDIVLEKGVIRKLGRQAGKGKDLEVIDADGRLLLPGFIDPHTHLRTPGREDEEDIISGTTAAAAGGYVAVCAMPNTDPVVDNAAVLQSLREQAEGEAVVPVAFLGSISRGLAGERLSDMWDLADAGAVAYSDDGRPVESGGLLRAAFRAARLTGLPLSLHCEESTLAAAGQMNEGAVSAELGLAGIPCCAESAAVARDLEIAAYERARVHIAHVSCAASLGLIEAAREGGAEVTAEVTPHHLVLTDESVRSLDSNLKMNPPLRSGDDRRALVEALADGRIECIGSDHAPHAGQEKEAPFEEAPFGVIGLETAFPVLYSELVEPGEVPLAALVRAMSTNPAKAFGLPVPAIAEGEEANLCLVDTADEFTIDPESFHSKSRNTPFGGKGVRGRVLLTIAGGREAYRGEALS